MPSRSWRNLRSSHRRSSHRRRRTLEPPPLFLQCRSANICSDEKGETLTILCFGTVSKLCEMKSIGLLKIFRKNKWTYSLLLLQYLRVAVPLVVLYSRHYCITMHDTLSPMHNTLWQCTVLRHYIPSRWAALHHNAQYSITITDTLSQWAVLHHTMQNTLQYCTVLHHNAHNFLNFRRRVCFEVAVFYRTLFCTYENVMIHSRRR